MCRILLAESDHELRLNLARVLDEAGYTVFTSSTLAESIKIIVDDNVDIAIVDCGLPNGDPMTIARRFCKRIGCLLMTGCLSTELHNEATLLGVSAFLNKPYSEEDLISVVDRVAQNVKGSLPNTFGESGDNGREIGDDVDLQTVYAKLASVSSRVKVTVDDMVYCKSHISDMAKSMEYRDKRIEAIEEVAKNCGIRGEEIAVLKEQSRVTQVNWNRIIMFILSLIQAGATVYVVQAAHSLLR